MRETEPRVETPPPYVIRLRELIERATALLNGLSEAEAAARPRPGSWSPKEILGHLVDSACNNHARFVNAQAEPSIPLRGYAQDAWVETQRYDGTSWRELIQLWRTYNLHVARLMEITPASERDRARDWPNLADIGHAIGEQEPRTLDRLMADYVEHLAHHLSGMPGLGARSTKE